MPTPTTYTVTVVARGVKKSIDTNLTMEEAIKVAKDELGWSDFAKDLVHRHTTSRHGLSPLQQDWLIYLAQERLDKSAAKTAVSPAIAATPAAATPANIGSLAGVYTLFETAKKYMKRVKIRVETADGRKVIVKVAERGRYPGSLIVTDGGPFGNNVFYGYVHATGESTVRDSGVNDILERLASDPAGTAAAYGKGSGECCFCGRDLTNSELGSAEIGYGPICAKHFHLPWAPNGRSFAATEGNPIHEHSVTCAV